MSERPHFANGDNAAQLTPPPALKRSQMCHTAWSKLSPAAPTPFPALRVLDAAANRLSGGLAAWGATSFLNLTDLHLSHNPLGGSLPPDWPRLSSSLARLGASNVSLTGSIPAGTAARNKSMLDCVMGAEEQWLCLKLRSLAHLALQPRSRPAGGSNAYLLSWATWVLNFAQMLQLLSIMVWFGSMQLKPVQAANLCQYTWTLPGYHCLCIPGFLTALPV